MNSALLVNVVLSFLIKGLISRIYSIANILQIVTHYPLVQVPFASNSLELFEMINGVVTFDIFPDELQEIFLNLLFDYPSDIPFNSRFSDLGYETSYCIASMFSAFVLVTAASLYYLYLYIAAKMGRSDPRKLDDIYAFYLRFLIEMSLEIGIVCSIEMIMRQRGNVYEIVSFYVSLTLLALIVFVLRRGFTTVRDRIKEIRYVPDSPVHLYWGALWEDLRI